MITPTTGTPTATTTPAKSRSEMDKDTFLKLLVAQLRYQDPTKPMDGAQFVAESAQFTTVEVLQKLQESQAQLLSFQSTLLSSGLIGKTVTAASADGREITGVVGSARVVAGQAYIMVNDEMVPVSSVTKIAETKTDTKT
ncbi:MAG: flagellar hook capping FlgD N-terminal domain-containing protein, partial [Acidimicrobiales bacterium]